MEMKTKPPFKMDDDIPKKLNVLEQRIRDLMDKKSDLNEIDNDAEIRDQLFDLELDYLKSGEKVNYKKYRLMGIQDKYLIRQLLDWDNLYFAYMHYHKKNIDDAKQSLRDEVSTDELD